MSHDHDSSYKYLFSCPELVRDLIIGFVPDQWLHSLDFSTLENVNASFVSEDFKQRHDDVIWRVKVGGKWLYLYLLIEFQSTVEPYMAVRIMVYIGLLYQSLIKSGELAEGGLLPPVLPIVLYNGQPRWTAATDIHDLIAPASGLVEALRPHCRYVMIDESAYADEELASLKNLVAAVFRLEHSGSPEAIQNLLSTLQEWLVDRPDLRRMFATWISHALLGKAEYGILLPQVHDLLELKTMLADKLAEWAKEYKKEGLVEGKREGLVEGKQEGKSEGEILLLQKLLSRRFGPIPAELTAKISTASLEEIERWFDRAVDAVTLADVFAD